MDGWMDGGRAVRCIHVTGTNGKGSVCAFLSAVLRYAGLRVGRYVSPHLSDWRESITLDERMIPSTDFESLLRAVRDHMALVQIALTQVMCFLLLLLLLHTINQSINFILAAHILHW